MRWIAALGFSKAAWWAVGIVALACGALGAAYLYERGEHAEARALVEKIKREWSEKVAVAEAATRATVEKYRIKEAAWNRSIVEAQDEGARQRARADVAAARADRADRRVSVSVAAATANAARAAASPGASAECATAAGDVSLLADLFGRVRQAARELAVEADRSRAAGAECERIHDAIAPPLTADPS